jgi:hypothetical protein
MPRAAAGSWRSAGISSFLADGERDAVPTLGLVMVVSDAVMCPSTVALAVAVASAEIPTLLSFAAARSQSGSPARSTCRP